MSGKSDDIRVTHILGSLALGGAERLVRDFCYALQGNGFDCSIICILGKRGPYVEELESIGVGISEVPQSAHGRFGFVLALTQRLRVLRTEIVHSQCAWSLPQQAIAAHLARSRGFVLSIQNVYPVGGRCDRLRRRVGAMVASPFIDAVVGVSNEVTSYAQSWLGLPADRITTIWNTIAVDRYLAPRANRAALRSELGLSDGDVVLVNVASLSEKKDQQCLLHAFARVKGHVPAAVLLLVGEGPLKSDLLGLAQDLGIGKSVRFLGGRADIPDILHASDLFVLTSIREGLPLAVVEAQVAGLPVVATDVGGVREIVRNGETGLIVAPRDVAATSGAVISILEDPEKAKSMGRRGRDIASEQFDGKKGVQAHASIYRSLAGRGTGG